MFWQIHNFCNYHHDHDRENLIFWTFPVYPSAVSVFPIPLTSDDYWSTLCYCTFPFLYFNADETIQFVILCIGFFHSAGWLLSFTHVVACISSLFFELLNSIPLINIPWFAFAWGMCKNFNCSKFLPTFNIMFISQWLFSYFHTLLSLGHRSIPLYLGSKILSVFSYLYIAYVQSCFSRVWLFETPWTVDCQAPLSMEFSRQEYWSSLPFPSAEDLPDPGIEPRSHSL